MNMQMKSSNLVACTCWHCMAMLMRSAPALQPHKSSAEVKLNSNAVWIEQMLPFFFVHRLLQILPLESRLFFLQLMDIDRSRTEAYSGLLKGADSSAVAYMCAPWKTNISPSRHRSWRVRFWDTKTAFTHGMHPRAAKLKTRFYSRETHWREGMPHTVWEDFHDDLKRVAGCHINEEMPLHHIAGSNAW